MFIGLKGRPIAARFDPDRDALVVTADEILSVTEFTPAGEMLAAVLAGEISVDQAATNTGVAVSWFQEHVDGIRADGMAEMIVTIWRAWHARRPKH